MHVVDETKPSWAEQVELGDEGLGYPTEDVLPPPKEEFDPATGIRVVTEYKIDEDTGKKVKVEKVYKIEKRKVSESIAKRKEWKKFGAAYNDPPGPSPANTIISEEIFLQFVHSKELQDQTTEEDPLARLKNQKVVTCRICKGDHWTLKCPYKDSFSQIKDGSEDKKGEEAGAAGPSGGASGPAAAPGGAQQPRSTGKYVPISLRDKDGNRRTDGGPNPKSRDETATIRVTNLSEDTRESDLQELFRPFGNIGRIFLAKDKNTGHSKGFAFINFYNREDAARAIAGVSGYGYDHLILNVEWAKPSGGGGGRD